MPKHDRRLPERLREATRLSREGRAAEALKALGGGRVAPAGEGATRFPDTLARGLPGLANVLGRGGRMQDVLVPSARPLERAPALRQADGGRVERGTFAARHGDRDYRLRIPRAADTVATEGERLPLVILLHGCSQDAEDFARGTRMDALGDAHDCFVLYPEQSGRANPQRCWNWFKHNHQEARRGEPAIVLGMLDELLVARPIDPARVYVAGLSAGGAMAAVLADVAPDRFAALGVHSGLGAGIAKDMPSAFAAMQGQGGTAPRASGVPTIVLHGSADTVVAPDNGRRLCEASVADGGSLHHRSERLHIDGRDVEISRWRDAAGQDCIEHWTIDGAAHAWSGGDPAGSWTDADGPDASQAMLDFFLRQRRA